MKLASFNVENLFLRARALDGTSADGTAAVAYQKRLNQVLAKPRYAARDKRTIRELLTALGLDKRDDGGAFAILRQNRSKLVKRGKAGVESLPTVAATGSAGSTSRPKKSTTSPPA